MGPCLPVQTHHLPFLHATHPAFPPQADIHYSHLPPCLFYSPCSPGFSVGPLTCEPYADPSSPPRAGGFAPPWDPWHQGTVYHDTSIGGNISSNETIGFYVCELLGDTNDVSLALRKVLAQRDWFSNCSIKFKFNEELKSKIKKNPHPPLARPAELFGTFVQRGRALNSMVSWLVVWSRTNQFISVVCLNSLVCKTVSLTIV